MDPSNKGSLSFEQIHGAICMDMDMDMLMIFYENMQNVCIMFHPVNISNWRVKITSARNLFARNILQYTYPFLFWLQRHCHRDEINTPGATDDDVALVPC